MDTLSNDPLYLKKRPTQKEITRYVDHFLDTMECNEVMKFSWIVRQAALDLLLETHGDIKKALEIARVRH